MKRAFNAISELKAIIDKYGEDSQIEAAVTAKNVIAKFVDPRVIMEPDEVEEKNEIKNNQYLDSYSIIMQKVLNETFQAAFIMNSGQFVLDPSILVKGQNVLQNLLSDIPFVSTILYATGAITDNVLSNEKRGKFRNFADLCPRSNPFDASLFSEKLSRKFTLSCKDFILSLSEPASTKQKTHTIDSIRDNIKNLLSRVNPALARGYFDDKMTKVQLLAFAHARTAVEYVMNQSAEDVIQTKQSIQNDDLDTVFRRILKNVLKSYEIGVYDMSNFPSYMRSPEQLNPVENDKTDFRYWLIQKLLLKDIPQKVAENIYSYLKDKLHITQYSVFLHSGLNFDDFERSSGLTKGDWGAVLSVLGDETGTGWINAGRKLPDLQQRNEK